ncbi:hypothetical protein HYS95_01145 [Candidatus Daviesbacteria bacterium]|nr:hypothetical protein [Candidatus Daviesbacteria bacterium]
MSLDLERAGKLRILIPDGKHAGDKVAGLLSSVGVPIEWRTNGNLHIKFNGNEGDLSLTVVKNRAISPYIAEGRYPVAFTTSDRVLDYMALATMIDGNLPTDIIEVARFNEFNSRLRVSLLTRDNPEDDERYKTPQDLRGKRVLTSYMGLGTRFFRACFPDDSVIPVEFDGRIDGKEEGLVAEGDAEAAIVSVDTGSAMKTNSLRELAVVLPPGESQIVLICNSIFYKDNKPLVDQFVLRLQENNKSNGVDKIIKEVAKETATANRFNLSGKFGFVSQIIGGR